MGVSRCGKLEKKVGNKNNGTVRGTNIGIVLEQCGLPRCGKLEKKVGNKNNGTVWGTKVWKV